MKSFIALATLTLALPTFAATTLVKNIKFPKPGTYVVSLKKPEGCSPSEFVGVQKFNDFNKNKITASVTNPLSDNLIRPAVCRSGFFTATILVEVPQAFGSNEFKMDVTTEDANIARIFKGSAVELQEVSLYNVFP